MKFLLRWCYFIVAIILVGCSDRDWRKNEILATPIQATLQQEVVLARIEQILISQTLRDNECAQLLYERGVLYDSLGLRVLAKNNFLQALLFVLICQRFLTIWASILYRQATLMLLMKRLILC